MSHIAPEQLSAYLDGEVTAEERVLIEAHLQTCEVCRADVESLRWTVGLVRTLPSVEVPHPFYVREADLAPKPQPAPERLPWARLAGLFRVLSYASAVSFVLLLIVTVWSLVPGFTRSAALPEGAETRVFQQEVPAAPGQKVAAEPLAAEESRAPLARETAVEGEEVRPAAVAPEKAPEDEGAEQGGRPQPQPTVAPSQPDVEAQATATVETAVKGAPSPAEPTPTPRPSQRPLGWWLALTALSTLVFGGLARWLSAR